MTIFIIKNISVNICNYLILKINYNLFDLLGRSIGSHYSYNE
ncbi:hypothetical protein XBFM1_1680002 [Xenorhabdus bovienii str. feltiae Moldova]|uniref:Uncharacterized protein n=1 Tax=Xenorhabdus bovienii str. feltiae Moldova TaxID=1398200 RepID=A0A077NPM2_XENBV|nr:hypothetical protein XBFM1_1680002 [Xenorhabdus bovienii str. feltiae Moldova]